MSYETLLYVWDAFTFVLFIVVLLSSLQSKNALKSNKKLLFVSFTLFTSMFLFYREQYLLSEQKTFAVLTFFTYLFSAFSHMTIVSMIVQLYTKKELSKVTHALIGLYSIIVGVIMAINVSYGSFISTHILIGIINGIPLTHLFVYIIKYDSKYYKNVFLHQVLALLAVYSFKTFQVISKYDTISFTTDNYHYNGMLMLANIIIFSFIISYLIIRNSMITEELESHKVLIEASLSKAIDLSEKDGLTNIFNRRKINHLLQYYFSYNNQKNSVFSIIMIDIDKFKDINDEYGHIVGDDALTFVANNLEKLIRETDIVSRWGGDEFLLLLPNTTQKNAQIVLDKLKEFFNTKEFTPIKDSLSLSFGLTDSSNKKDIESIISAADEDMYKNKPSQS